MVSTNHQQAPPWVSIIIPNYNGARLLPACLESIKAQTFTDYETLVVDDCSQDDSRELLRHRYPWVRLILNPTNQGPAAAKNRGLQEAAGRLIAFMDTDVTLAPDWLEQMARASDDWPDTCMFASKLFFADAPGVLNSTGGLANLGGYAWDRGVYESDSGQFPAFSRVLYACSAAVLAKKAALQQVGGFDALYRYPFEDVDLGWRLNLAGWAIRYVPAAEAWHKYAATMGGRELPRVITFYERNRQMTLLKNLEAKTLRDNAKPLAKLFFSRLSRELTTPRKRPMTRLKAAWAILRAPVWNISHLAHIQKWRRHISELRQTSDASLIDAGLIAAHVGWPQLMPNALVPDYFPADPTGLPHQRFTKADMTSATDPYLGPGWHIQEIDGHGKPFRWTSGEAILYFVSDRQPRALRLHAILADPARPPEMDLYLNDEKVASFRLASTGEPQLIPLTCPVASSRIYALRLRVSHPTPPVSANPNADPRELGVGVLRLQLLTNHRLALLHGKWCNLRGFLRI